MAKKRQIKNIQSRLGMVAITTDRIIHFPKGLIGLAGEREFTLLNLSDDAPFLVLQSVNTPSLGLLVADPYSFLEDFKVNIGESEKRILRIKSIRQLAVLVTVTIPHNAPERTSLNLTGPIVINTAERVGLQVPQTDPGSPGQVLLKDLNPPDRTEPDPAE